MHIVHVTRIVWEHGTHGGMEAHSRSVVAGLRARGHRVTTITTACPACDSDGETLYLPGTRPGRYSSAWWRESVRALEALHARQPVDAILSQSVAARGYALARKGRPGRLPVVVVLHGTHAGELRTRWRNARSPKGVALLAKALLGAGPDRWRWRRAIPEIDRFVAVSEQVADDARRALGIPPARLDVVVSGVDTDLWKPDATQRRWLRQKLGLQPETRGVAEDTPILVAAGRVERGKGFHLAIDSLAALREFEPAPHLVICGAGSAVGWLRERAAAAGVSHRVHFAGFVEPPLLARTFQGADALLMPSMAHEALPLTLLQALATGLPAIASDVGGIPTAVQHGENGLLLPLGDVEALASAVRALLADPERRQQMSAVARQRAVARFSLARMVGEIENVLRRAVAERRP